MTTDLDDLLRAQFQDLVPGPVASAEDVERAVRARVAARQRRRRLTVAGVVAAVFILGVAGGVLLERERAEEVATGDGAPRDPAPGRPVAVETIEATGGPTGTERVVVQFDGPIPADPPTYVADIQAPDAPGVAYTTQAPDGLRECQNTHWFPGDKGRVDVLVPEAWLAPDSWWRGMPITPVGDTGFGKVVTCGPYKGYAQVSIWGPASDDERKVHVFVEGDGARLVIEIEPE